MHQTNLNKQAMRLASGFFVLALLMCGGCNRDTLIHVSTEKEANKILVALAKYNINDAKIESSSEKKGQIAITVGSDHMAAARKVLEQQNLPHESTGGFDQMMSQASLIPSASDDRAKFIYATTGELEKTFEAYDGVVEARVHVVIPENDSTHIGSTATSQPVASAMVLIKARPATTLPTESAAGANSLPAISEIKKMVARSVQGVNESQVEVHFTSSEDLNIQPIDSTNDSSDYIANAICAAIGIVATLMGVGIWNQIKRPKRARPQTAVSRSAAA